MKMRQSSESPNGHIQIDRICLKIAREVNFAKSRPKKGKKTGLVSQGVTEEPGEFSN